MTAQERYAQSVAQLRALMEQQLHERLVATEAEVNAWQAEADLRNMIRGNAGGHPPMAFPRTRSLHVRLWPCTYDWLHASAKARGIVTRAEQPRVPTLAAELLEGARHDTAADQLLDALTVLARIDTHSSLYALRVAYERRWGQIPDQLRTRTVRVTPPKGHLPWLSGID